MLDLFLLVDAGFSFSVELTLSASCSRFNLPLFRQGAALSLFDSFPFHNLVICTGGAVPFPFGKGGSGVLFNYPLCGAEITLFYLAALGYLGFTAEVCVILQALHRSRRHQQVCHFSCFLLLSDSHSVFARFSSPTSFLVFHTLWHMWQNLFFLSSPLTTMLKWVPGHYISPAKRHGY